MELGKVIYNLRKQQNMTLEEVGSYVGVGKSTVRKWENGLIENMKIDKIKKLAQCFGVTINYLLSTELNEPHLDKSLLEKSDDNIESLIKRPDYELSEKFIQDYAELLKDKSFIETTKLYNEISPELRAVVLGYIVGLLRSYNIDTKKILGY